MGNIPTGQDDIAGVARNTGFSQCVLSLRRTLATTPMGWALVAWMSWAVIPHDRIWLWLSLFCGSWAIGLVTLQSVIKAESREDRHRTLLFGVAMLDGGAWGLTVWLLMGIDPILDPWLSAVLCGVVAINAPIYVTYIRAFYALTGAMWSVILLGLVVHHEYVEAPRIGVGISVFFALIVYYMQAIAERIQEGIRLQLTNTSLAEQLRIALKSMEHDAATDVLTGQPNRRALDLVLKEQLDLAERRGQPFALLMLDIDFFKHINDTHGHSVGDDTLRAFAFRVRDYLRQGDVFARYGGEEFVVVLPRTAMEKALEIAERLRAGVEATDLLTVPQIHVTVSIGVTAHHAGQSLDDILKQADLAVYAAKAGGRNQVRADTRH